MSQPRKIRIRTRADYGAGSCGHDHNYSFVFSDNIEDWQKSKRATANFNNRKDAQRMNKL